MDFREQAIKLVEKANLCYRTKEYKILYDEIKFTQAFLEKVFNTDPGIIVSAARNSEGYLVFSTNYGYIGRVKLCGRVTKMQLLDVDIEESNEFGVAFVKRDRVEEYIELLDYWIETILANQIEEDDEYYDEELDDFLEELYPTQNLRNTFQNPVEQVDNKPKFKIVLNEIRPEGYKSRKSEKIVIVLNEIRPEGYKSKRRRR